MSNRIKLKRLNIAGFRGIRTPVPLDFGVNCRSLVLFGSNGDGKSSFSDAIEWFLTDRIAALQREGCGRDDYFNKYMPEDDDATVEIEFNNQQLDSTKTLERKGGYRFSNSTDEFIKYVKSGLNESFILRYHTMRDFIDKTKKDKLEKIEEIIGFDIVKTCRESLLKAVNTLRDDSHRKYLEGKLTERKRDLVSIMSKDDFSEPDVLNYADRLAKRCDNKLAVTSMAELGTVCEILGDKVKSTDKGKTILQLEQARAKARDLHSLTKQCQQFSEVIVNHNKLAQESETIKATALEKLYEAAINTIQEGLTKTGECPVCGQPCDTEKLLTSLKAEIAAIQKVLRVRKRVMESASIHEQTIASLQNSINVLLQTKTLQHYTILQKVETVLEQYAECMHNIQESLKSVSALKVTDTISDFPGELETIKEELVSKIKVLSITAEEKAFYRNVNSLLKLHEDYERYKEIEADLSVFRKQGNSLNRIYEAFERMEKENVEQVLQTISSDVNDYMKFLHPDDHFDEVELSPTAERGIEFKLTYHGKLISPPLKVLSEAHLNSLGICVFLAAAKHFNRVNGFLVLDDVVTSFDTEHRRPLIRLLHERFPNTQFLLFTHDRLWFEMLKTELPLENWIFKELVKWTKEGGCSLIEPPLTLREQVDDDLADNDTQGAATKSRILIEQILKEKCENLGVRGLEFRRGSRNDQRSANELIDALLSYLKTNESLREKECKTIFNHVKASQLVTNFGSHHQTLETTSLSRGDIESVMHDVDEFNNLFICIDCGEEPHKKFSPQNSKLKQCKCGKMWI